ncbi:MAG: phosphoribosyltransferase family protein [Candidatus Dojkabacteria bacterium]
MNFHQKDLDGSDVILADDFVQSGGTIVKAVDTLRALGAGKICLVLYHGFLYQEGYEIVKKLKLQKIIMTDTLPVPKGKNLKVVSIANVLAKALY